jgi:GT2 family glycosyltransferase
MISLVLVAHRSSRRLPAAAASFRAELGRLGLPGEVVVVEQSEDPEETARIEGLADRLLVRPNRGYAAGLNAGIAAAAGEVLLLGNPDVCFEPGALAALLDALDAGWDVAGPQFVLAGWLFPPADEQTPGEELRRQAASRRPRAWQRFQRRELRRWSRVWESPEPVEVPALSGALLAVRRPAAERIGPWDDAYFLYYEETDWLRRARELGMRLAVVPGARVEHAWGHAAGSLEVSEVFGRSRERYFARWFGERGRAVAELRLDGSPLDAPAFDASVAERIPPGSLWLLSPSPLGFPAAGRRSEGTPLPEAEAFARRAPHCPSLVLMAYDPLAERQLGAWRLRIDSAR